MPKTVIIIADTALEIIPYEIRNDNLIKLLSNKNNKKPSETILDSTFHYKAMRNLKDNEKRGRPDILHYCLLNILGIPLVKEKPQDVRILVHTIDDKLIEINPLTRIPKHYVRFVGLMEKLLLSNKILSENNVLLQILPKKIKEEIDYIPTTQRFIFTSKGIKNRYLDLIQENFDKDIVIIVGGFPHGNFSSSILELSDIHLSIYKEGLEAWIVISRILYHRELTLKL
ncbi:MAG: 16S rRNA methyltransferase [Candidatus Thorarchaeota archaeon]